MDIFDSLSTSNALESSFKNLEAGKNKNVGIFKPDLKKISDPVKGYRADIRFLPNIKADGTEGILFFEKTTHYINPDNFRGLPAETRGYYECGKDNHEDCPLCAAYWALSKSTDPDMKARESALSLSKNYYSYIYMMNNELEPELNGKVFIWKYPKTIYSHILQAKNGELLETGKSADVFSLTHGHDFRIKLTMKAGTKWPDYSGCKFLVTPSPIKIAGNPISFETVNGAHKISAEDKASLKTLIFSREAELESFMPKPITDEERAKVQTVISVIMNKDVNMAINQIGRASSNQNSFTASSGVHETSTQAVRDASSFFDDDDE